MAKIVITNLNDNTPRYPAAYQLVAQGPGQGTVVLFFSEMCGVVVKDAADGAKKPGYKSESWLSCTDRTVWKPVNLSIEH